MQSDLSLARLYPPPRAVYTGALGQEELATYGDRTWYCWCITHWGTKWDVEATLQASAAGFLEYAFASAWSPPVGWLVKVANDFPVLRFVLRYDEPGMGFMGLTVAQQGTLLVDECVRYA